MLNVKQFIDNSYSVSEVPYTTYYLKPDYNISNKDNISIANAFSYLYKPLVNRLRVNLKETEIQLQKQIYFTIALKRKDARFYISIPDEYDSLIKGKMSTVWPKAEIRKEDLSLLIGDVAVGELLQKDYSFKSLNCNTKDLYPLTNMLGITKSLKDKQEVRVTVVVEPFGKKNWLTVGAEQLESYKAGKIKQLDMSNTEKAFNVGVKLLEFGADMAIEVNSFLVDAALGLFVGGEPTKNNSKIEVIINDKAMSNTVSNLSEYTRYKLNAEAFKTRILISARGGTEEDNTLAIMNVANSYRDLQGDNELLLKMVEPKKTEGIVADINSRLVKTSKKVILSDKEIAKLIQLPQKDLQVEFSLDRIDTREVDIPKELQGGKVRIGIASNVGKDIMATFNDNYNVVPRTTAIIGPQGAGKTTILKRLGVDNYKASYANFILDYVENCETAREVGDSIPAKDKVVYDVGARGSNLSFAFNEVSKYITEDMDVWERVRYANMLSDQVELVLNTIKTDSTSELTSPMMRYLHAACMVTFIRPGATINDAFRVIKNHKARAEAVSYAKQTRCFRLDDDTFTDLEEIDKKDTKGKITGTRTDLTVGIENRITMLTKHPDIKDMLNNEVDLDDDFGKYIEEGKTIVVMIPQNRFPNEQIRDVLAVYYFSRLWLACQLRVNNKSARLCNVIIDEVGQVEILSKFIGQYCTEFRRHRLGLTLAMHHLDQLKGLLKQLTSSGASYMLLAGIEKKNAEALKEEIQPFTLENVLALKTHTSLNVVNYGNQYARFIAAQPEK